MENGDELACALEVAEEHRRRWQATWFVNDQDWGIGFRRLRNGNRLQCQFERWPLLLISPAESGHAFGRVRVGLDGEPLQGSERRGAGAGGECPGIGFPINAHLIANYSGNCFAVLPVKSGE